MSIRVSFGFRPSHSGGKTNKILGKIALFLQKRRVQDFSLSSFAFPNINLIQLTFTDQTRT